MNGLLHKIKQFATMIRHPGVFKMFMGFYWHGYLFETGWLNAYKLQKPVGKSGEPLPWVTYSFIDFIQERLRKEMTILEYGSGNSTLFYSSHVKQVYAVEHDLAWFNQISEALPKNAKIAYVDLEYGGAYSKFVGQLRDQVDVIIVDGRDRVNCIRQSIPVMTVGAVLVLDDSERKAYQPGIELLLQQGFKRLDFWGISPGLFYKKCTSIFYKSGNCLNL